MEHLDLSASSFALHFYHRIFSFPTFANFVIPGRHSSQADRLAIASGIWLLSNPAFTPVTYCERGM
jgi:hypothetical protein